MQTWVWVECIQQIRVYLNMAAPITTGRLTELSTACQKRSELRLMTL